MNRLTITAMLSLLGVFSYAQAVTCRKGIPCGNTCISASYTCHVGGPVTPPVTVSTVQTLTSPPLPAEPSGTYFGWSVVDDSMAIIILSGRTTAIPYAIGYTKLLESLTPQDARARLDRVLNDEVSTGAVIFGRQNGTTYQLLARRPDGSRGVLISLESRAGSLSLRASAFSASGVFNIPGFTATTREAVLAQANPIPASESVATAATEGTVLTINPDTMVTDPASGKLIVTAQCQPFSFAMRPPQAFSKITLTEQTNQSLSYSLDVTVDGKLRFTEASPNTFGAAIPILVGQHPAGTVINFAYSPLFSSQCKGVMTIGLKVE